MRRPTTSTGPVPEREKSPKRLRQSAVVNVNKNSELKQPMKVAKRSEAGANSSKLNSNLTTPASQKTRFGQLQIFQLKFKISMVRSTRSLMLLKLELKQLQRLLIHKVQLQFPSQALSAAILGKVTN